MTSIPLKSAIVRQEVAFLTVFIIDFKYIFGTIGYIKVVFSFPQENASGSSLGIIVLR